jgi:hypothetical protein
MKKKCAVGELFFGFTQTQSLYAGYSVTRIFYCPRKREPTGTCVNGGFVWHPDPHPGEDLCHCTVRVA